MKRALLAILLLARVSHADVTAAARAFSEGQAAQLAGDYDRAAQDFELAYSIIPSKEALRSAVRARQLGGQLPRAATLAELLLLHYADDPISVKLANDVIAEAKPKLGRIAVTCSAACTLAVDGKSISPAAAEMHAFFVAPGERAIEVGFEGGLSVSRVVTAKPGDDTKLEIAKPAPKVEKPPPPPVPRPVSKPEHGLSPIVPLIGGVVTLGLAGGATWSGISTLHAHDAYVANPTDAGWTDGRHKQLRTNLLIGAACVTGVATAVVAVFWTRWHHVPATEPTFTATAGGVTLGVAGSF